MQNFGNFGMNGNGLTSPIFTPPSQILEVDGMREVLTLPMGPNSSALALDKKRSVLWVIRTDQNCNKTDTMEFDITPHVPEPDPAVKSLEDRMGNMEKQISEVLASMKKLEELTK